MATSRIVKVLRANTGARDLRTVFEDFCAMAAAAISATMGWMWAMLMDMRLLQALAWRHPT